MASLGHPAALVRHRTASAHVARHVAPQPSWPEVSRTSRSSTRVSRLSTGPKSCQVQNPALRRGGSSKLSLCHVSSKLPLCHVSSKLPRCHVSNRPRGATGAARADASSSGTAEEARKVPGSSAAAVRLPSSGLGSPRGVTEPSGPHEGGEPRNVPGSSTAAISSEDFEPGKPTREQQQNLEESMAALASLGRTLDSLPPDLARAVERGRIPGEIVNRLAGLEESAVLRYLLRFGGFRERLLADDLFLTKLGIECGVGICTKTSAELERRRGMFFAEFDFVIADVIMAIIADFMLVWLPAPTVALTQPGNRAEQGSIQRFLATCPDNAFQVALRGEQFSVPQRCTAILRNGIKLLAVGTFSSLFGTGLTNGVILLREALAPLSEPELPAAAGTAVAAAAAGAGAAVAAAAAAGDAAGSALELPGAAAAAVVVAASSAVEVAAAVAPASVEVPILATSLAYGVYMAISSNLRYQVVAGVIEQRILDPWLHDKKLALSVMSFAVRTGNTFLGSLLWVDFARWVGVQ